MADPLILKLSALRSRMRRRASVVWLAWSLVAAVLAVGLMGLWQALGGAVPGRDVLFGLALIVAMVDLLVLALSQRRRSPSLVQAARLAERQLGVSELFSTVLTLPQQAETPLEAALAGRVRRQADGVAGSFQPAHVRLPGPGPWLPRLALLAACSPALWALPILKSAPPAVQVQVQVQPPAPDPSTPDTPTRQEAGAQPSAPSSSATAEGQPASTREAPAVQVPGAMAPFLRESNRALGADAATKGAASTGNSGGNRSTLAGSREGAGQAQAPRTGSEPALAAAPYDPGSAGSQTKPQRTGGKAGTRTASGGRGLESDSRDKCVAGCLTNSDMNRGNQPRGTHPQGTRSSDQTQSGTSDSGGTAAGASSSVGLGSGQMGALGGALKTERLTGGVVAGEQVQVLSTDSRSVGGVAAGVAGRGAWVRSSEAALPDTALPDTHTDPAAQAVVGTYFARKDEP